MMKYLCFLLVLMVSCTPPPLDDNAADVSTVVRWDLPAPTAGLTRAYHPADGRTLNDSIPEEKEIIQRMNVRLECLDGSRAERIDVVRQDCVDCYQEWIIDCRNDNQFLVVVSEQSGRGGFYLFEGKPFE